MQKKNIITISILSVLIIGLATVLFFILNKTPNISVSLDSLSDLPEDSQTFLTSYLSSTFKTLYPNQDISLSIRDDSYTEYPVSESITNTYFIVDSDSLKQSFEIFHTFSDEEEINSDPIIYCLRESVSNYPDSTTPCHTPSGDNYFARPTIYNKSLLSELGFNASIIRSISTTLESEISAYYLVIEKSSTAEKLILTDEDGTTYSFKISLNRLGDVTLTKI